ncbi:MAG: sodium-dependent transporter [Desulfovermiculus sp.]
MAQREQWGTRIGFILAAVGSAIGLGNIWRFPYMVYDNGGGAFLIPYFFALFTAGIPIIILEFGMGSIFKGSAPKTLAKAKAGWEWLGWWQVLIGFTLSIYYVVIIAWALIYTLLAVNQGWGQDTKAFFYEEFLQLSSSPMSWEGIVWPIFIAAAVIWVINWGVMFCGVKSGVEKANKVFMPILFVLILTMLARTVTLNGVADGLQWLFQPDFSAILDYKVWAAAYGQIFFSLSICFGVMITFSSYLPEGSDIVNNGVMIALINCGFNMLAGIMIFGVLGFMAQAEGVPIEEVAGSGVGLAFVTIPKAIGLLPGSGFFGILMFLALVFAGLSSMISLIESTCAALMDRLGWSRGLATTLCCSAGFVFSLIFMTRGGLLVLDIVDHFLNNFGMVLAGLVEIILLSWFFRLGSLRRQINAVSDFAVGPWWNFCLKIITPLVLGYMALGNLIGDIRSAYGGYPGSALFIFGWAMVIGLVLLSLVIHRLGEVTDRWL